VRACRSEISQGQGEANEQTAEASKFLLEIPNPNSEISLTPNPLTVDAGFRAEKGTRVMA
jgi:hypothetical protein